MFFYDFHHKFDIQYKKVQSVDFDDLQIHSIIIFPLEPRTDSPHSFPTHFQFLSILNLLMKLVLTLPAVNSGRRSLFAMTPTEFLSPMLSIVQVSPKVHQQVRESTAELRGNLSIFVCNFTR